MDAYRRDEYAERDRGHVHDHSGKTSCNDAHAHLYPGVTGPPRSYRGSHTHTIRGVTTYDDEHTHSYLTQTGLAIELPGGYHTHLVRFQTNLANGHRHRIEGYVMASRD